VSLFSSKSRTKPLLGTILLLILGSGQGSNPTHFLNGLHGSGSNLNSTTSSNGLSKVMSYAKDAFTVDVIYGETLHRTVYEYDIYAAPAGCRPEKKFVCTVTHSTKFGYINY